MTLAFSFNWGGRSYAFDTAADGNWNSISQKNTAILWHHAAFQQCY